MILNTLFGNQMAPERHLAPANTPVSQVEGARPAGIGGFLGSLRDRWTTPDANGMDFGQRLTRFGAELQDTADGGQRAAAIHQRAEAERQQRATTARQQQASQAFQSALRPDGSFDGRAYLSAMAQAGQAPDVADVAAVERMDAPQIIEGPDGIYQVGRDGRTTRVQDYPTPERPAPVGMRWKPDGSGLELIPGYAEGQQAVTGARRDAVIARPAPSRAKAPSGGRSRPSGSRGVNPVEAEMRRRGLL